MEKQHFNFIYSLLFTDRVRHNKAEEGVRVCVFERERGREGEREMGGGWMDES